MTLCDTGPLVALIDRDDRNHARCVQALTQFTDAPFISTWPCLTEAMYLLWRAGKLPAQEELWGFIEDQLVIPHAPSDLEWERMRELMRQYHDLPMDFADASLVAAAEELNEHEIFTLDSHFRIYRIHGTDHFTVVP